jgi:hypothetical protein
MQTYRLLKQLVNVVTTRLYGVEYEDCKRRLPVGRYVAPFINRQGTKSSRVTELELPIYWLRFGFQVHCHLASLMFCVVFSVCAAE